MCEIYSAVWKEDGRWMWDAGIVHEIGTLGEWEERVDGGIEDTKKAASRKAAAAEKKAGAMV